MSGERTKTNPEPDSDLLLQLGPSGGEQPCHQEATVRGTIPGCYLKLPLVAAYFKSLGFSLLWSWHSDMNNDSQAFAFQVNIHIFQSGDKRAAEGNGVCEYL